MSKGIDAIENLNTTQTYKWTDPFEKALIEFRSIQICDAGLQWCEEQYASNPSASYGEVLTNLINDHTINASWALTMINVFVPYGLLDDKLLEGYITKIINDGSPSSAYVALRYRYEQLSPKQRKMLRDKYADVLKNVEII